ncbi:hypothetical protein K443DRAFT_686164 [Laccaria amethystina LaAM-08-1]|uniref:Uncharacterized protein n=1 Tax=Laccaria amethystina LaAM-08-1 TaxID=1095629 RepID=A0A0C9WHJ5_9AGAR|nr:hypothetical protein K443DRAFT_686164 [Laccaria amethystina LaAM-08-1]
MNPGNPIAQQHWRIWERRRHGEEGDNNMGLDIELETRRFWKHGEGKCSEDDKSH